MNQQKQSFSQLLDDLDAGVFEQKVTRAVAEAAMGVASTGKKGKVVITLDLKRIGDSNQVEMAHGLRYMRPTKKGKVTEEDTTTTPLHVGVNGMLTLFPETQQKLDFMRDREEA